MTVENDLIPIQQLRELLASGESNEELVKQITNLFPALIYVYDTDRGKIRYINRKITDILGYSWEDVATWKEDLSQLVYQEDLPAVLEELKKLNSDAPEHCFQCRLSHKEQTFRIFKTVGTVLRRNANGAPASLLLLSQDITEQIKLEEERSAARQLIDDTEQMLGVGMWSHDQAGGKTDWSDGMYQLMGYNRQDLPQIPSGLFYQHVCPKDLDTLKLKIQESLESGKEFRHDFSIERKDGKRIFITTVTKPVVDESGTVLKLNGINRDISDQYQQTMEYNANKEFQKETERMLNYGIFIWNADSKLISWSDGLFEIFEYERSSFKTPLTMSWYYNQIVEDDREKVQRIIKEALTEKKEFEIEYSILTGKGNLKIVNTKGTVVVDNRNNLIRMIGNTRDITHIKKVEIDLQRNLRELNRSNKELEEFAYAASHDLQEPLRKITTFGSRLFQKFSAQLGDEGFMYINRMQVATDHMRSLIENLLELSRVTRNKQPFESVSLDQLFKDVISDLELSIEETGAKIQVGKLPQVDAIPSLLRQLFINILSNSIKFHRVGESPKVEISSKPLTKKEKEAHFLSPSSNYIQIDIRDHGIGFDQEYEQRIFQVFQRLHGKSEYPGTGIGLAICKRIAERHNGFISASGKEGEGAVFSIILPEKQ
jgi:PAS domain S-box-containing protein